ncbi:MAG: hypothetical protein ABL895_02995 [Cyclobacteriaceae bacterium]
MDTQFWIWLIVIVITLIARANKKKPQQPFEPRKPDYRESAPDTTLDKPISFEDLLREIQAAKAPKPVAAPPAKKYDFEDYDDDIKEEAEVLERTDYRSEDSIYETYDKAKRDAFSKASLEETLKVEDTVVKFEQQKGYQQVADREAAVNEYVKELKNPTSFKKAFILSEILGRRF